MKKVIIISILLSIACIAAEANMDSVQNECEKIKLKKELEIYVDQKVKAQTNLLEQQNRLYRDKIYLGVGATSAILLTVGISSFIGLYGWLRKKIRDEFNKAFYAVNPAYISLKVPKADFTIELKRLKWFGFKNIKEYTFLDKSCTSGCVVVKIDDEQDAKNLVTFLEQEQPGEKDVAYILYTKIRIDPKLFEDHPNVTLANMPLTIGQAVLVAARALVD